MPRADMTSIYNVIAGELKFFRHCELLTISFMPHKIVEMSSVQFFFHRPQGAL